MGFVSVDSGVNTNFENAGEHVDGHFKMTATGQGRDGNSSIHTIQKEDGSMASFWGSTALDDKISKCTPGDFIRVQFEGTKKSKTGRDYKDWAVFVDHEKSKVVEAPSNDPAIPQADDEFPGAGF